MRSQMDELLQKRMDRKGFLKHVAIGFVMMTGFAGLVKMMSPAQTTSANTYGAATYGGSKPQSRA